MNFSKMLENIVSEKTKTWSILAEKLGISKTTLSDYANGKTIPNGAVLAKLKEVYPDLSTDWILSGKGEMYESYNKAELLQNIEDLQKQLEKLKKNIQ